MAQSLMRNQGRNMVKHSKKRLYKVMGPELALNVVNRGRRRS